MLQIGSVTKTFTCLALAEAVVSGSLSLDTPLAEIIRDTPKASNGEQITLGHLASHTAGLPRLPKGLRRQALRNRAEPYSGFTSADLLAALQSLRPHAPGTPVRYSNFGAALLGQALSQHHQLPYGRVIADRVTGPLGLTDTTIDIGPELASRAAASHSRHKRPVAAWNLGAMPGAGALWSTTHDLQRYLQALITPHSSPMRPALRLVQQPRARANRWVRLGLGWHLSPLRGTSHTMIWHNGATAGSYCYVGFIPETELGVVVLTNTGRSVDALGVRLLTALAKAASA
jgi:CubicO group peptidase (beta-lactamase class C family)